MGKYDVELDLSARNSLYLVIQHLSPGVTVLELGPANGRLTKYMSEKLHCSVDIVEMDEEAGRQAAAYANKACLGPVIGNIDLGNWVKELAGKQYDCIVCADVLEHLRDPARTLGICLGLLKQGGSLVASVPNIAHNGVIISLLQGRFDYTDVGLLDNTHIHFFSRQSFREMAVQQGFAVAYEEATYVDVPDIELGVDYGQIDRSLARALKCREDGIAYQYIFELKRREDMTGLHEITKIDSWSRYVCECFPLEQGQQDYTPLKHCLLRIEPRLNEILAFSFDLSNFSSLQKIRLDPLNTNCLLKFIKIELIYENEKRRLDSFIMNGTRSGDLLIFTDEDPQIFLDVEKPEGLKELRGEFEVILFDDNQISRISCLVKELENQIKGLENHIRDMESLFPIAIKQLIKKIIKTFS